VNKTCEFCGSCVTTIAASFADFECGTTWSEINHWKRSMRCREAAKADE